MIVYNVLRPLGVGGGTKGFCSTCSARMLLGDTGRGQLILTNDNYNYIFLYLIKAPVFQKVILNETICAICDRSYLLVLLKPFSLHNARLISYQYLTFG